VPFPGWSFFFPPEVPAGLAFSIPVFDRVRHTRVNSRRCSFGPLRRPLQRCSGNTFETFGNHLVPGSSSSRAPPMEILRLRSCPLSPLLHPDARMFCRPAPHDWHRTNPRVRCSSTVPFPTAAWTSLGLSKPLF